MEINKLKKLGDQKDEDIMHLRTQLHLKGEECKDMEDEIEMKSEENNRLRLQVADQEKAI